MAKREHANPVANERAVHRKAIRENENQMALDVHSRNVPTDAQLPTATQKIQISLSHLYKLGQTQ